MGSEAHFIALLANKNPGDELSHIKNFPYDPDEITYSTGWVIMANPSDGQQRGNATLAIDRLPTGESEVVLTGSFVNKRKLDGDTFVALAGLFSKTGEELTTLRAQRGLDGTWENLKFRTKRGGATDKKTVGSLDDLGMIILSLGYEDTVNDAEFWNQAAEIAKAIWDAYNQSEQRNV